MGRRRRGRESSSVLYARRPGSDSARTCDRPSATAPRYGRSARGPCTRSGRTGSVESWRWPLDELRIRQLSRFNDLGIGHGRRLDEAELALELAHAGLECVDRLGAPVYVQHLEHGTASVGAHLAARYGADDGVALALEGVRVGEA